MALPNASPIVKVYYGKPVLPEVSRVLACLYEKDFQLVAFQNVDCMPVDLIRLQASTSVPAPFFEDGSKFLFESRAICRYISETYADRGNRYLLGRDLLDRVSIEQWLKSEEQSFDPPSRALVLHLAFPPSSKSYNELLEESDRLAKILDVYDHRLGESRYLAGDEFTLADLTHLPNSQYIATSKEWGHLFDERENVKRWWEDMSTRPSWSKVAEEIRKREEDDEEEEEEMTQELDEYFIGISRPPTKTSLKASIFEPIEASAQLPVKPKTTFIVRQNAASPMSSVQITVPDKRAFSVSVPAIKGAPIETDKIQPHSTVDSDEIVTQPGDASGKTKQPVTDAKVRMEDSTIPPTGTQVPSTAHIDKTSTKPPGATSQYTMPVTDARVTMEEAAIPPTGTQVSSTAHIDKASTKPTGGASQSTMPVTDAKVTMKQSAMPPTGTQVPSTAPIDKASTKPTGVTSQSRMPVTDAKVTTEESAIPPTNTQVPSTAGIDKTSTKVTGVEKTVEKTFFPPPRKEALPTSKMVPPTKPSLDGTEAPPTEKTSTKTPSKGQGQITTTDSKWGQAGEERTSKEEVTEIDAEAYLAAKHKMWEEQWRKPEKFGEEKDTNGIQVEKPKPPKLIDSTTSTTTSSETARQELVTESKTTTKSKDDTPPAATQGSGRGKISETSPAPTATSQTSLSNSTETQGGVTNKTNNVLDPKPPKSEGTTPLTTPTPAAETTPQTATPEPMTNKLTTAPAKDPSKSTVRDIQKETSPGKTATKPQDTSQAVAALKTTIPDATQQPPPPSTNEATSGIGNKSNNLPKQSPTATFPTVTAGPMTDTSNTVPAPVTSKPADPAAKENSSRKAATKEPKKTTPSAPESATIPAASQKPSSETAEKSQASPTTEQTQTSQTIAQKTPPANEAPRKTAVTTNTEKTRSGDESGIMRTEDEASPIQTSPKDTSTEGVPSTQTTSSDKEQSTREQISNGTSTLEAKAPSSNDEQGSATQQPPPPSINEATSGIGNKSNNLPKQSPTATFRTDAAGPMTNTSNTVPAPVTSKPADPAAKENSSQKAATKERKKTTPSAPESATIPAASQKSSSETAEKSQASPTTEQTQTSQTIAQKTPPANEAPRKTAATTNTEKTRSGDESGIVRTEDEASPIQTSPKDTSTEGVPSTQTTPSDKEQSTREQISNGTSTLEAKAPSSNDEQGSATQQPPPPSTNEATSGIGNKSNNLPKQSPTATFPTVTAGPMTDTSNTVPAPVTSKPADPAAKENSSRKAATKEPKETTPSAPESATIPAASQKSSGETAGKSQASPTTEQTQTSQTIAQKTPRANEAPRKTAATPNTEKARSGDESGIVRTEDEATPIQTPSKEIKGVPPETSDIEKTRSVDEIGTERTKGEASPIQTPPKDTSTEGVPPTQTTPSDKEQSTREQISNGTTLEAKAPSSNDEQGSESKTKTDKSGTSKSNQTDITQPNKFNDATTRNKTLSDKNQNVASQQDKEGISSNESSTKSPTKQNGDSDSINKPGPANNE